MGNKFYSFCIAGTNSGVGKTTITLGLIRALKLRGLKVAPFKCGPDYIDTAFHKAACGTPSRNLDSWMAPQGLSYSFEAGIKGRDCAVIEGVMGLFDGARPGKLEGSTADVAISLNLPILLVVNAKGMAGSISAIVKGYCTYCPEIKIIGVIANNVSSERHAEILRRSLELDKLAPLLGWFPRDEKLKLPERQQDPYLWQCVSIRHLEQRNHAGCQHLSILLMCELCKMVCFVPESGISRYSSNCKKRYSFLVGLSLVLPKQQQTFC